VQVRFKACSVADCDRNAHRDGEGRAGLCSLHYQRKRAHGDPLTVISKDRPAYDWLVRHAAHEGDDCLPWPFHTGRDGYGRVHRENGRLTTASRLMCEIAHGPPPSPTHEAAHSCGKGNRGCTNPRHLRWDTPTGNHADKIEHGTTNRGERQGAHKLSENDVRTIRRLAATETQASIARHFRIDQSTVSDIKTRRRWGWLA
jgi:hypothetical protein